MESKKQEVDFSSKATEEGGQIFLKDYDIEENEHFVKNVFIPYFKDVFKDLCERSDKKSKGISKLIFQEVKIIT
jgi:hypothetical protein